MATGKCPKALARCAQPARDGDQILILCAGYWARGKTAEDAYAALEYSLGKNYIVYSVAPGTTFDGDDMHFRYPNREHPPVEVLRV